MFAAYLAVTWITILANAAVAAADLARAKFALANADEVHVARSWMPVLGILKAAGAAGLLLGIVGIHVLGIAAAAGLVLFFIGALGAHLRAHVLYNIAFPGAFLALSIASLVLAVLLQSA